MRTAVIIIAQYFIVLSLLGTFIIFLNRDRTGKKSFVARLIIGGILAIIIAVIARHLYSDPRPFVVGHFQPYFHHAPDNGFVSDHTLLASFLAFSAWFYNRKASILLLILAVLIGAARVIAGVHHWVDIASAIGISLLAAWLAHLIVGKISQLKTNPKA